MLARFLIFLPLAWAGQSIARSARDESPCTDTHIFLARGLNEDYPGRQGILVEAICSAISANSCDYEDILYHSTFDANYCDSIFEGVGNGISQLHAYNKRCPNAQLVVSGYSQGAYVVGDMFAGGGGTFGDCVQGSNEGLDVTSEAGKKVTGVITWGSKRHTASQPYNTFTGAGKNGTYPRPIVELEALEKWKSVLIDYCVITDPNCAGGNVNEDHWNYFELYSEEAAEWVKSQVENNATAASSSLDSSSITDTPTQTSTPLSTASTTAASGTSTSSSGSAASTSHPLNLVGLAIAGSLAACI
ncbi:Alpha/Beta hydrolase protein [Leptodontidium sp. 2 PMI_412]|nr:Alpha/Beta hydrolase protein [Leptodontidium sp. 2 PMI_412]